MKTRIFLSILTIATCFIFSTHLNATIKGSEAAISVEPYYDFLSTETDNSMLGFGWFKNGFGLEDSSTTCTFESIFPVSGDVYLNGGFLHLNSDLLFRNMMTWHTPGTIVANDYVVDFSSSVTTLGNTSNFQVFDNSIVNINSDLIISGSVKFSGNCLFNGNGKRVLLGDNGYLLIDENTTVTFKDIYIDGITEGKISCLADSSNLVLDDVRWIQDGDYSFTNGSFKIFNQVDFTGSYTFSYESGQTSTIHKNSRLVVVDELVFVVGRKESQDYVEPLCFQDETSILKLHDCSLIISDSGMCLTRGTVVVEGDVFLDIHSSTTQNGFVLGDGTEQGDMKLKFNPGSAMHYLSGHLVDNVTDPGFLSPKQENARLIRYANTVFHLQQNINIANLIVDSDLL
ncbi:hypothetical protein KAT92_03475, partial [Candidatus Babeliales bacterium]|nr:hypothetical protein [Candidatus Babeliales bacterium]